MKEEKSAAKLGVIRALLTYMGCLPMPFPTYEEFIAVSPHDKSICIAALHWHTQFSGQRGENDASAVSWVHMETSREKVSLFPFHPCVTD